MSSKNIQVVLYPAGVQAVGGAGGSECRDVVLMCLSEQGYESVYVYDPECCVSNRMDANVLADAGNTGRTLFVGDRVAGNAGCLRGIPYESDTVFVLIALSGTGTPDLSDVIRVHQEGEYDLTAFVNTNARRSLSLSMEVFVFDAGLLEHIPPQGYWDVQENLIPELVVLGKKVKIEKYEKITEGDGDFLGDDVAIPSEAVEDSCDDCELEKRETLPLEASVIKTRSLPGYVLVSMIPLMIGFAWAFYPILQHLWQVWMRSDEYSSGLLVPFLAGYVLWVRREQLKQCRIHTSFMIGVTGLMLALGMRFLGIYSMFASLERLSFLVTLWALVLWGGGWRLFLKVFPVLLFLGLMLPWPNRIHSLIMVPLQNWATVSAVFSLEMLGYTLERAGNVIKIGDTSVAVAEACNGLRMITAFFVIGGLVALLAKRSWWEKLLIVASCLPIALMCNTIRLTVTSIAFTKISGEYWETVFHDFGGYAMMPLALLFMVFELWIFDQLFVSGETTASDVVVRSN